MTITAGMRFCALVCLFAIAFMGGAFAQSVAIAESAEQSGYRRIGVVVEARGLADGSLIEIFAGDDAPHTAIRVSSTRELAREPSETAFQACLSDGRPIHRDATGQGVVAAGAATIICSLTGMTPGVPTTLYARLIDQNGRELTRSQKIVAQTDIADTRLAPPDTRPILYALGTIASTLIVAFAFLRRIDVNRGRVQGKNAYFYIGPAVLGLALLTFYPIFFGIWLGFTDAHQDHLGEANFVGLENFGHILDGPGLFRVSLFTAFWVFANVFFHVSLGLLLALVLNRTNLVGRTVYRTILLLPWAIPAYISVLAWQGMLQPDGLVNLFLSSEYNFLGTPNSARLSVTLVNIWLGVPFMMMSLSGALKAIPSDMYEAAEIDGVSKWKQFRHITLPNLKGALVPLSLLGFIWTFNMFNTIYLLTRGSPYLGFGEPGATDIMVTYIFDLAFEYGDYGLAAAWSVAMFLLLLGFSIFYVRQTRAMEASG